MNNISVAVIGAGIGGLATAAALRRVGIEVTVYEQARRFARIGAGIQIGCNAMKVLRGFGLEPNLRAAAFYPRSWNNRDFDTGEVRFTGAPIAPAPNERPANKDTVKALPGLDEDGNVIGFVTRLVAKFDLPNEALGYPGKRYRYVYHCHILEHEDNEMMRPFAAVAT